MTDRQLDTPVTELVSGDSATDTTNPLTDAIPAEHRALTLIKVRIGVQFSNNPLEFTDTPKELTGYVTAAGWTLGNTWYDLFALAGTTPRMFVRFVALARNTSGALAESAQCRIRVRTKVMAVKRLAFVATKANTAGSDTTYAYTALTEVFETWGFGEHRAYLDLSSSSGGIRMQVGLQETDTPDDPTSWVNTALLGTEVSVAGVIFPTSFASVTFTKKFGRYVLVCRDAAGGAEVKALRAAGQIHLRSV